MAIKIEGPGDRGVVGAINGVAYRQKVDVIADTEAEITLLPGAGGEVTDKYGTTVKLDEGSTAYTAEGGELKSYILMPTTGWQRI